MTSRVPFQTQRFCDSVTPVLAGKEPPTSPRYSLGPRDSKREGSGATPGSGTEALAWLPAPPLPAEAAPPRDPAVLRRRGGGGRSRCGAAPLLRWPRARAVLRRRGCRRWPDASGFGAGCIRRGVLARPRSRLGVGRAAARCCGQPLRCCGPSAPRLQ